MTSRTGSEFLDYAEVVEETVNQCSPKFSKYKRLAK